MPPVKLAIVSTHPIQYYAPIFRALASDPRLAVRSYYTWSQVEAGNLYSESFGINLQWDIPLLDGYEYEFVQNIASKPGPGPFFGIRTPGLVPAIKRWGAQAVLVFGWNCASHLAVLGHFKGRIPVYFRGDSVLLDPISWHRALARRAVLASVYSRIDVALAVGSNNADYFRWAGVPTDRIRIVPHSIDVKRFADEDGTQAARALQWRSELGISSTSRVIVFAAKFTDKKDPLLLLRAFRKVDGDARLVFVGNGPLSAAMADAAAGDARIHFLPFQNQRAMPAVYRLGDVFAMPSRGPGETWGLALNEAMASGRPVIASSRVGGARDLVTPGVNGWLFEAGDEQGLKAALDAALALDPRQLAAMGAVAQSASSAWSSEATAQRIGEIVTATGAHARS